VKANNTICDSAFLSGGSVTTDCVAITVYPSVEPFATYLPSTCWKEGDGGSITTGPVLLSATASSWDVDGFLNSGTTGAAKINIDSNVDNDWLISPYYSIPSTGFRVKYSVGVTQWNGTVAPTTAWEADDFVQLLATTDGITWAVLKTYDNTNVPSALGQIDESDLSAYNGQTVRFAFRGVEGAANGGADVDFFVDNFTVEIVPVAISATGPAMPICQGTSTTLNVTSVNPNYVYTWSPSTGLSATTGSSVTATPGSTITYTVSAVDGFMATTGTVTVTVNPTPSTLTLTPASTTACANDIVPIVVTGGSVISNVKVGAGALSTASSSSPYRAFFGGQKTQSLYTAAELTALGFVSGSSISSLGYVSLAGTPIVMNNFTINAGLVSATTLGTAFIAGASTNVFSNAAYTPATGIGTIDYTLATPIIWDGTSNLLVETCFNNNNNGGTSANSLDIQGTTVAAGLNLNRAQDSVADVCTNLTAPTANTVRPNLRITFSAPATILWSSTTDLYTDAAATIPFNGINGTSPIYFKGSNSSTYSATATLGSCSSNTATTSITVNPIVTPTFAPISPVCLGDAIVLPTTSIEGVTGTWSPAVDNTLTTLYTFTPTLGLCSPTATLTVAVGTSTTWTAGTPNFWSNGLPTITSSAIIATNYAEVADIVACTLTVNNNAVVTIPSANNVTLNGALTVATGSTFTLSDSSNLIQSSDVTNIGDIIVNRTTPALMRLDYVLWSSPVANQNLLAFSPSTLVNRFYTYNPSSTFYETVVPSTTSFGGFRVFNSSKKQSPNNSNYLDRYFHRGS
jgi:hypothetical protein